MPNVYDDEQGKGDKSKASSYAEQHNAIMASIRAAEAFIYTGEAAEKEPLSSKADSAGRFKFRKDDDGDDGGIAGKLGGAAAAAGPGGAIAQKLLGFVMGGGKKRKAAIGGGITGVAVTGGILMTIIGQGSLFELVHVSQFLQIAQMGEQDKMGDDLSSKFLIYALAGRAAKGRLGVVQNTNADKWEKRLNDKGLKSVYSPTTQRLIGYEIQDASKSRSFLDDMRTDGIDVDSDPFAGVGIDGKDIDQTTGNKFVNLQDVNFRTKRSVTRTAVRSIGVNKISSAMGARLLIKRGGVNFHPLKNILRKKGDDIAKWNEDRRAERAARLETGKTDGSPSPLKEKRQEIKSKLQSLLKTFKGPLLVVVGACTIKGFSESIDLQNLESQGIAMRIGVDGLANGAQLQAGDDVSAEMAGVAADSLHNAINQTSWDDDPGVKEKNGEEPTGTDYLLEGKPGEEKAKFFQVVDQIPTGFGVVDVCTLIEKGAEAINAIPGVGLFLDKVEGVMNGLFGLIGVKTPDEFIQMGIDHFSSGAVNVLAEGSEWGAYMNIGARMASNNQFQAMGGRELTDSEASDVVAALKADQQAEFARGSIYDKYFNLYDSRSAVASMYLKAPKTRTQLVASISSIPRTLGNMALTLTGLRKAAAAPPYDYGFPLFGFSLEEQDDPNNQDPYANEIYMMEGDRLARMNAEYGQECFGMTVTSGGDLDYSESGDFNKIPDKCKDPNNQELVQYRFYHANMLTGLALACYEDDEDACKEIGMSPSELETDAPTGSQIIGDPYSDTLSVACDARTEEIGEGDGYVEGVLFKVRLCSVPNFPSSGQADNPGSEFSTPGADGHAVVNSRVSGAWYSLVADAKLAGIDLSATSSFRSMAHQQYLWDLNGHDPSLVAPPGFSSHQAAVAIDFANMHVKGGETCETRATSTDPGWVWLYENAEKYGFKQYAKEAWHWDALPASNRCGGP